MTLRRKKYYAFNISLTFCNIFKNNIEAKLRIWTVLYIKISPTSKPQCPNGQLGIRWNWFWSSKESRRASRIHMYIRIQDSRSFAPAVSHSGFMSAQQMFLGQVPRPVSFSGSLCRLLLQLPRF